MNNETLVNSIRELCRIHNITVTKLEETLGMSQGLISRWAKSDPSLSKIIDIANYFRVSIDELLGNIKYEYIDTIYKVEGFYFNDKFFKSEHYILASKNGDMIHTGIYLNNPHEEFEKLVLPKLLENGCTFKNIKSEEEIKWTI